MVYVKLENDTVNSAENFVKMIGIGELNGMILVGPAGMGKTYIVENTLQEMKKKYIKYGGHITLAAIYEYLCENQDKTIFFDDCSNIIQHTEIMELLKQALQTSGERRLHYRSYGAKISVPKEFIFTGQIIMAFNTFDVKNPNVKAVVDRAPAIELKFNREEIFKAMYLIAKGEGGGLMEHEKLIVTREIEKYAGTDSNLDISLRKQQLAFKIYRSFKKLYGDGNLEWKVEVQKCMGKKKETWIREMIKDLVGDGKIKQSELVKQIAIRRDMSPRTVYRRIVEFMEMGEIYQNKSKGGDISIEPFKSLMNGWC